MAVTSCFRTMIAKHGPAGKLQGPIIHGNTGSFSGAGVQKGGTGWLNGGGGTGPTFLA